MSDNNNLLQDNISWKEAIHKVLAENNEPLHYTDITEQILSGGYYKTDRATPFNTVNSLISTAIRNDGEKSPFVRVAKGIYTLRDKTTVLASVSEEENTESVGAPKDDTSDSIIHSFGMYWQRDFVEWRNEPKIYGKQLASSKPVDFGKQKGIYILYDHHTVVYVGRSIDRTLGRRMYEHTIDRLGSRWNRFSWFGLLDVTQDGDLRVCETVLNPTLACLVETLEALLIEALEPPQNRKRGDDFSGIEYIQVIDPELKKREILNSIEQNWRAAQA